MENRLSVALTRVSAFELAAADARVAMVEARADTAASRPQHGARHMTDDALVFVSGAGWMTLAKACAHYGRTIASTPDRGSLSGGSGYLTTSSTAMTNGPPQG